MRVVFAMTVAAAFLASCKTKPDDGTEVKDIEIRQASTGNMAALYSDRTNVFIKGCKAGIILDAGKEFTRKDCDVDLKLPAIALETYKTKLGEFLKFESPTELQKKIKIQERDLGKLQAQQIKERGEGKTEGSTFLEEIAKVEASLTDLRARLETANTIKVQFDRIVNNLVESSNTRFYVPASDFVAAIAPFGTVENGVVKGVCYKTNSLGMVFCDVPKGSYVKGLGFTPDFTNFPPHKVTFTKDIEMAQTELTQEMWQTIMGSNPSKFTGSNSLPVEQVSWDDIVNDFLPKLNERLQGEGYAYRLPTDDEWEYAARAESTAEFGVAGDIAVFGWVETTSGGKTSPVAQLKSNLWGLYDVHGNVWEWVQDSTAACSPAEVTDPPAVNEPGKDKVIRGGSWANPTGEAALRNRGNRGQTVRNSAMGFRLVRTPINP